MTIHQALNLLALLVSKGWHIEMLCKESLDISEDNDTILYSVTAEYMGKRCLFFDETDLELTWIERLQERAYQYFKQSPR